MSAGVPYGDWMVGIRSAAAPWPENLVARRSVDSTNRLARSIADALGEEDETPRPTLIVAWEQTEGKGRLGNRWESRAGLGLYSTLIWPLVEGQAVASLPLLAAVALCDGLSSLLPMPCRLDWPNDLVVAGRKLGGILIEAVTHPERTVALVGFGVNLEQGGDDLPAGATSLRALGAGTTAAGAVLRALADRLAAGFSAPPEASDILARYRAASIHQVGELLSCRVGAETVAGTFAGFDPSGFLCLATAAGLRTISSGEIVE